MLWERLNFVLAEDFLCDQWSLSSVSWGMFPSSISNTSQLLHLFFLFHWYSFFFYLGFKTKKKSLSIKWMLNCFCFFLISKRRIRDRKIQMHNCFVFCFNSQNAFIVVRLFPACMYLLINHITFIPYFQHPTTHGYPTLELGLSSSKSVFISVKKDLRGFLPHDGLCFSSLWSETEIQKKACYSKFEPINGFNSIKYSTETAKSLTDNCYHSEYCLLTCPI